MSASSHVLDSALFRERAFSAGRPIPTQLLEKRRSSSGAESYLQLEIDDEVSIGPLDTSMLPTPLSQSREEEEGFRKLKKWAHSTLSQLIGEIFIFGVILKEYFSSCSACAHKILFGTRLFSVTSNSSL